MTPTPHPVSFAHRFVTALHLPPWAESSLIWGPATFLLTVILGLAIKRAVYARVKAWADGNRSKTAGIVLEALHRPLVLLILGAGLVFMTKHFDLGEKTDANILLAYRLLVVLAGMLLIDGTISGLVESYADSQPVLSAARGIVKGVARFVLYALGTLVCLDILGIPITPLLASLGVGSLAVALALQEPLSNLFSGLSLLIDKPIQPGHYIHLEALGVEGTVDEVSWRNTKVRTLQNNLVLVPNAKLVSSVITNYDKPEAEMAVPVSFGVSYDSDLPKVEAVTQEVARSVMAAHGLGEAALRTGFAFTGFGDSAITCAAVLRATRYSDRGGLIHDFIKALHVRFKAEGIVMPYPTRTLEISGKP